MSAWTEATLATDDDLTKYESVMPQQAKKLRGDSGASAYEGKRDAAKEKIAVWLERHGYQLSGISVPAEFNRAATFLELSLIYRDMARRNDSVSADKANYYASEFTEEIDGLSFTYDGPSGGDTSKTERPVSLRWRA